MIVRILDSDDNYPIYIDNTYKMSGLSIIFNWITDVWNYDKKVTCVVCGTVYTQASCGGNMGDFRKDVAIVDVCGESCFSSYVNRKANEVK